MTKLFNQLWTVVQHSGCGYGDKPGFRKGLEERCVTKKSEKNMIIKAGGIYFKTYKEASKYCMKEQYPPEAGMYPRAPGKFSHKTLDDLRIYIPLDYSTAMRQGAIIAFEVP